VKNPEEDNSVAEVYLQAGPDLARARAALDLLEQCAAEPFYDTLRTKEQLGYSVHAATRLTHGVLGFAFVVNSGARSAICACSTSPAARSALCMRHLFACLVSSGARPVPLHAAPLCLFTPCAGGSVGRAAGSGTHLAANGRKA
jgi:hypothetical protein